MLRLDVCLSYDGDGVSTSSIVTDVRRAILICIHFANGVGQKLESLEFYVSYKHWVSLTESI